MKGKKQIDFIVTTSNPNDESNAANKKRVRSVAALKSWPERRKKIFEQLGSTGSGQGAFLVDEPSNNKPKAKQPTRQIQFVSHAQYPPSKLPPANAQKTTASVAKRTKYHAPPRESIESSTATFASSLNPVASVFVPTTTTTVGDVSAEVVDIIERRSPTPPLGSSIDLIRKVFSRLAAQQIPHEDVPHCQCAECRLMSRISELPSDAISAGTTAVVVPARKKRLADGSEKPIEAARDVSLMTPPTSPAPGPSAGKTDPFNLYPVKYQPWFDQILHHMITVYAPRGWPALRIKTDEGVRWEWFMTQNALAEPALFYVRLLFGSGDMIRLGGMRAEIMYWLRSEAIKAINEALGDPQRSSSDALILAIGRIALHEFMNGDKFASSHVHRPAQKRMIEMRGGMKNLPFPPLVKRLMRWSDRLMAIGSGTERMLEDDEENPTFTLKESVAAIQRWAPHEMPSVRSKIRISDLVND